MKTPALFKEYIWLVNTIHSATIISRKTKNLLAKQRIVPKNKIFQ